MALQEQNWCDEQMGGPSRCDPPDTTSPFLFENGDQTAHEDFINPPMPLKPSLSATDAEWSARTSSERKEDRGIVADTSTERVLVRVNEDLPRASGTMPVRGVRTPPHECSLCGKVFGSISAINKHMLTHQQDRPHVCPTCQRAFKRQDHLTSHLLTHQRRKQFHCTYPGCQKSYCDPHSLKRHQSSHHQSYVMSAPYKNVFCTPLKTSSSQWKVLCGDVDPFLGNTTEYLDYCSVYHSPFKPAPETQHKAAKSYPVYTELTSVGDLETASFLGSSAFSVLDPWDQGEGKTTCHGSEDKAMCGTAWHTINMNSEPRAVTMGPQYRESALDLPVSEVQALEKISMFKPCVEAERPKWDFTVRSAGPKKSRQRAIVLKQVSYQPKQGLKKKGLLEAQSHPFSGFQNVALSKTKTALNPASGSKDGPTFSYSNETQPLIPPSMVTAASCTLSTGQRESARSTALTKRARKVRIRKKKPTERNVPAPPLPPSCPSTRFIVRRSRPRTLHLLSPSQVAMASFGSNNAPCHASCQALKVLMAGDQPNICLGGEIPHPSEYNIQTLPHSDPSRAGHDECLYTDVAFQIKGTQVGVDSGGQEQMEQEALVIPVSVPVMEKTLPVDREEQTHESFTVQKAQGSAGTSKKTRRFNFMKTLFIPGPVTPQTYAPLGLQGDSVGGQWCRALGGYHSHLRSPVYLGDQLQDPSFQPFPYTPPPMLSPVRPGAGLYLNTLPPSYPCPPPLSTCTAAVDATDGIALVLDDTVVTIEPRINVGFRFQAEIPPLQNLVQVLYEEHPGNLVWAPCEDMGTSADSDKRVKKLLDLCSSSALPGGGTNLELALHCLHDVQGNILAALDLLLIKGDYRSRSHAMWNYHYFGSDYWSPQEKRAFRRALMAHGKDFQVIQSVLQGKSAAQCVEYYYAMKKLKKFKQQPRETGKKGPGANSVHKPSTAQVSCSQAGRLAIGGVSCRVPNRQAHMLLPGVGHLSEFTCMECGRGFEKVRSRSAHMKRHRRKARAWPVSNGQSSIWKTQV